MNPTLPPNQRLAAPGKWPLVGEKGPRERSDPWTVSVDGLIRRPRSWTVDELRSMAQVEREVDIHCVTRWSKIGARFGGVEIRTLLDACKPMPEGRFLSFVARSERKHSTSLPIADAVNLGALVALTYEGEPLEDIHGGPVRVITPGRYFYKSLKWLERIEALAEDRLGYWENEAGYHNIADPWKEQRYIAPNLDPKALCTALESRDLSGLDFPSLDARGRDLSGLNARHALLRNANFQGVDLRGGRFDGANLSNAHFQGADLRGVSLRDCDAEGADFRGADLRGADFIGASIFGATFVHEDAPDAATLARIDSTTLMDVEALAMLTPRQLSYVLEYLAKDVRGTDCE